MKRYELEIESDMERQAFQMPGSCIVIYYTRKNKAATKPSSALKPKTIPSAVVIGTGAISLLLMLLLN